MKELIGRFLSGSGHSNISYVIFFVFLGLLVGAALRGVRGRIKIPYTPVLLILGLIVGLFLESLGLIGESGQLVSGIEPSGILLIFLPILIFESSFNADWHVFKHSIYQILVLIGPGLAINFGLIAVTMKLILGYSDEELSWTSALMFGCIVGVTDPVAIVALLKEMGAPHYFSTIIEGESLLNDGSGMAFFAIFSNLAAGKNIGVGLGIASFLFLCAGGVLLGLAFGFFASKWQERINKDAVLSITIVFCAAYLLFWISESYQVDFNEEFTVGVSGIIALCIFGLYMAAFARTVIPSRVEVPLHAVVSWAQYASETIIFLLTGLLVGEILNEKNTTIQGSDWGKLIAFFVLLNIIRMISIAVLSPILNRVGYKLSFKELLVLSFAGIKGSLALVLALSIDSDEGHFSQRTRELVLLYTAGTASLTILVNGLAMEPFMKKIKMVKKFPAKSNVLKAFVKEMDELGVQTYQLLREENPGFGCDWDKVRDMAGITSDIQRGTTGTTTLNFQVPKKRYSSYIVEDQELRTEARFRLLQMFKQLVWNKYKEARLGGHGANALERAVDVSLDDPSVPIKIFEFLHGYFMRPKTLEYFTKLSGVPVIGFYFKQLLVEHMVLIYEVNASISEIADELKLFSTGIPIQEGIMKKVLKEFEELKNTADSYQNTLGEKFSGIMRHITTKNAVTKILITQKKLVEERYKMGEINDKEYNELISLIDKKVRRLHLLVKFKWEPPSFLSMLTGFPLFNLLSPEQLDSVVKSSKVVQFSKGQVLYEEGKKFDGIYLIKSGEVTIECLNHFYQKGMGTVLSLMNIVMFDNISRMTCVATRSIEAHKISVEILREIMEQNNKFEESVYRGAFNLLRFMKPEAAGSLTYLSESGANSLMNEAHLIHFSKDQKIPMKTGGFVLKGSVKKQEKIYGEYSAVPQNSKEVLAESEGLLLQFHINQLVRRQSSVMMAVEKLVD